MFKPVSQQVDFNSLEEQILSFWEQENIYKQSVENRKGKERFVFFEGPPTANGKPHMGHVLQRSLKDLVLRYQTMKGRLAERRGGWDTHGLPVELEIEKELGLKGKQDILSLKESEFESIKYFNEKCKESVFRYVDIWIDLTKRIGFWIDFDSAYVTYKNEYIESIWNFIKEIDKKGLLYKDYKVVPYCPRCGTALSSHELAQGYKDDVEDPSVFVKFPLKNEEKTYFLVWTTTPWTLPGNVALAVGPKVTYVKVKQGEEMYILAEKRLEVLTGEYENLGRVEVSDLIGQEYKPLYEYLNPDKKAYFVVEADFASDQDGTGIVHTAVMYGADDFDLGKKYDLPMKHLVNLKGEFTSDVEKFSGMFVKKADGEIIKDLTENNLMYKAETVKHTYPFCWRCSTPILYYALDSWFIKTTDVKQELLKNNELINWVPSTIKTGRMKNWLETLIDWNISRSRFWGTPLPVWECSNGHRKIVGSKQELKELSAKDLEDLHRPFIDEVAFDCSDCSEKMKRVPEVMDVWMDSGAMPFAQWHYPFENQKQYHEWQVADYIVEGIDQTRGWFFTLMAEAMLRGQTAPAPFKNVISTGLVLDEKGAKMSKSKGNVVNPMDVIPLVGADSVRWYLFTAAPAGGNIAFSKELVQEKHRKFTLILWNCYKYLVEYASLYNWNCELEKSNLTTLDRWVLSELTKLVLDVNKHMDEYNPTNASRRIEEFVTKDLSTWYIRRSRDRVGQEIDERDRNTFLSVLYGCMVTLSKLLAPFTPFVADEIYKNLTDDLSVHLTDYPKGDQSLVDQQLMDDMVIVREVVEKGHSKRKESNLKLRQPLASLTYTVKNKLSEELEKIIAEELNVKLVNYKTGAFLEVELDTNLTEELKQEGEVRDLIRQIQQLRKDNGLTLKDRIEIVLPSWPDEFKEEILRSTNANSITTGESVEIRKV